MEQQTLNLKIGEYQVLPIPTGVFGLDGGAMFGTVPKVLWEKAIPADSNNRIPMEARALLLKGKSRNILIDCGNGGDFIAKYGEKLGGKFKEMYNVSDSGPSLLKSLAHFGVQAGDITDVILTHLHFDHCGGGTTERDGKLVPTFPKARYFVQKANLETAKTANIRERASYFPANYEPLIAHQQLHLLDGDSPNVLPGISTYVSNGHTQGHQMVKISDGTNTLLYCGDVVPTSAHIRLAWVMGYDLHPLTLIEEKRHILTQAAQGSWYLYFEHDPFTDLAQIEAKNGDFSVHSRFNLTT